MEDGDGGEAGGSQQQKGLAHLTGSPGVMEITSSAGVQGLPLRLTPFSLNKGLFLIYSLASRLPWPVLLLCSGGLPLKLDSQ